MSHDLVLLGGGHTHALVLRKWAMNPLPGARLTLVNPDVKAPYTGMLPGFVAGHYQRADLDVDLVKLARAANASLIVDRAVGINLDRKRVELAGRPALSYDTLSIDIGITSDLGVSDAYADQVIPAKPLGAFADAWEGLLKQFEGKVTGPAITIIGAGVAGVELALAMAHRLEQASTGAATITLVEAGDAPLRELNGSARKQLMAALRAAGIVVQTRADPDQYTAGADFVVSTAGARPYAWLEDTGLALQDGFIRVTDTLQTDLAPDVFAVGDCAHLTHAPRPKAGVFAVRQAPVLFENLQAQLKGSELTAYRPQRDYLKLISMGRKTAATDKWGIGVSGDWVWRWKDRIDQDFMDQFRSPVEMASAPLPRDLAQGAADLIDARKNACGGCAAKVGQSALAAGLNDQDQVDRPAMEDAAIVKTADGFDVFSTDHLRAFTQDAYVMARLAAIHALGDIWAMGATPKTVLAHIILPPLSPIKQSHMIQDIMAGAGEVFSACGTEIQGGHTSNGAELTIGFSIQGQKTTEPIRQSGAKPGDAIVLTKPIGTGVILAAEMRQLADGDHYQAAIERMSRMQDTAARLLSPLATAMTDVTGFGLAGHMLNILDASEAGAVLNASEVPLLSGALELSQRGIRSTLWAENFKQSAQLNNPHGLDTDLLFDPQTCGGLLATIPEHALNQVLRDFEGASEPIWRIGEIVRGESKIQLAR